MGTLDSRTVKRCLGSLALGAWFAGCAHTVVVEVPPKIDLGPYGTIGIVEFSSNSSESLNRIATRKFLESIQQAQPKVRFLELGPEGRLLETLGRDSLDPEAIRAIHGRYGVNSVFTGRFEISGVRPDVSIGADLSSLNASAVVNISMSSMHRETGSGATVWSNSRRGQWKVAGIRSRGGDLSFRWNTAEDPYGRFLEELAVAITDPFRAHAIRRKVPK